MENILRVEVRFEWNVEGVTDNTQGATVFVSGMQIVNGRYKPHPKDRRYQDR